MKFYATFIRKNVEYTLLNIGIECIINRDRLPNEEKFMKFIDNIILNIDFSNISS